MLSVEEACPALPCPQCRSSRIQEQPKRPSLGYRTFRCAACTRRCNERSGTPSGDLRVPTDVVSLVVLWRLRSPLRLRHLAEMFLGRGFACSHETVRNREALVTPLLTGRLRARGKGEAGPRWHADGLRHEVAFVAVETPGGGRNRAYCRPYPPVACGRRKPAVRSPWDTVASPDRALVNPWGATATASIDAVGSEGSMDTPAQKATAVGALRQRGYRPRPLRRTYSPKANGTMRPLGMPNRRPA